MRAAPILALLLVGCTAAEVDKSAHVFSAAAPLLALIPAAGPACVIALKAACAVAEVAAEWPEGPGVPASTSADVEGDMLTPDTRKPGTR